MVRGKLTSYSQVNVLRSRMEEAGFTHGREARVNLRGVRIDQRSKTEGIIYFCNMNEVEVVKVLQEGDGQALPQEATLSTLHFPKSGKHDLLNAVLYSNGTLQVRADEKTRVVRHEWKPVLRRLQRWLHLV